MKVQDVKVCNKKCKYQLDELTKRSLFMKRP